MKIHEFSQEQLEKFIKDSFYSDKKKAKVELEGIGSYHKMPLIAYRYLEEGDGAWTLTECVLRGGKLWTIEDIQDHPKFVYT